MQEQFEIKEYDGLKPITSLPVFPIKFSHSKGVKASYADFVARGRRYIELTRNKANVTHRGIRRSHSGLGPAEGKGKVVPVASFTQC